MSLIPEHQIFANDHYWNPEAAIMLGRFLALSKFKEHIGENLVFAISPDFFYGMSTQ